MAYALVKTIVVSNKSYISPKMVFHARNLQLLSIEKPQSVTKFEELEKTMTVHNRQMMNSENLTN
ncbi:hypothetical protein SCALIN_C28_0424 [Candidatus Scalindua japonica]|uniref:Uncharacterized protein n=2 Tax=Candidatus Scalindua japonica TaxID=1284222 RepID=A0A286U248_9BACT|nr:hypothetical protein SCALIN_C28_0424 [Candidatus Scalindua japonica]